MFGWIVAGLATAACDILVSQSYHLPAQQLLSVAELPVILPWMPCPRMEGLREPNLLHSLSTCLKYDIMTVQPNEYQFAVQLHTCAVFKETVQAQGLT